MLDRDTVLAAALALADAEGLEALTMRSLAGRLGVTPMALYNHVGGRADLLDGVADLAARDIERPSPRWGWRRRLRAVLLSTRRVCLGHPAAVPLLQRTRAVSPALLAPTETALGALEDAGLTPAAARAAWTALVGLTLGHASYQLAGHMDGPPAALDAERFPHVAALAQAPPFDWDRAFARALDALIEGLTARSS